jgi:uncharacterized damage-inducible protein DinB
MAIAETLLPDYDHEMDLLARALERVPADRLSFRPHPKSRSLGELAHHLARIPGWVGTMLEKESYDLLQRKDDAAAAASATPPLEETLALFEANRARAREAIAARSDAELLGPWRLERGGAVVRTMTRARVLRAFLLDHVIHHRGQLSVYLRLLDVPVPGLYGPSADEPA